MTDRIRDAIERLKAKQTGAYEVDAISVVFVPEKTWQAICELLDTARVINEELYATDNTLEVLVGQLNTLADRVVRPSK